MNSIKKILVTGGAGYVGSVLVPKLLKRGYQTRVLDLFMFDNAVFAGLEGDNRLEIIKGDIRDTSIIEKAVYQADAVIHLAAISNDPCSELNPTLTQQVNYDAIKGLVKLAKRNGVQRFISASSSSVYGVKDEPDVTEDLPLEPITLYARLKAESEKIVNDAVDGNFTGVNIRSATVCGYSPRMRLDLTVNILTSHAVNRGVITVFGGKQKRPNVHIDDVTDMYTSLLTVPANLIKGEVFNFGTENYTVLEIAELVRKVVGNQVKIEVEKTIDERSYHISSRKIKEKLGLTTHKTIEDAITGVAEAFAQGRVPDYQNSKYYNVKKMKELGVQ